MVTWRRASLAALLTAFIVCVGAPAMDLKLLPADTEIVFTVNWKQMLDSPLLKSNKDALDKGKETVKSQVGDNPLFKYLEKAGFDLFNDLQSVSIANNGGKEPTAFVVEGRFDVTKFSKAAEEAAKDNADSVKTSKIGERTVYEISLPENKTLYAALLSDKTLVGYLAKSELEGAITRSKENAKIGFKKKEFSVLLSTVKDTQSLSFVATGAALSKLMQGAPIPNGDAAAAALEKLDGLSGAVTLGSEIEFEFGINAVDEPTAKKMAQDAQTALPVVQFMVNQQAKMNPQLAFLPEVTQSLRVVNQGSNLLIKGKVSSEVIAKMMKSAAQ